MTEESHVADRNGWRTIDASPGINDLDRDALIATVNDASRLWLAHDGLWFLEFEKRYGMHKAIEADAAAWAEFTKLEAQRIMARLGVAPGGGVQALALALRHRLYANLNKMEISVKGDDALRLRMLDCRVQAARKKKGLTDFPCKSVGLVEYAEFAKAIDPRFAMTCVYCPPDAHPGDAWCAWEFQLMDSGTPA